MINVPSKCSLKPPLPLTPHRRLITGSICGVRVEDTPEPLMQEIRYLDKIVDELAKGKPITSIMRKPAAER